MDLEDRTLLYVVALATGVGLHALRSRGALRTMRVHAVVLAVLFAAAGSALLWPGWGVRIHAPLVLAFVVLVLAPALLLTLARRLAAARRLGSAEFLTRIAAALVGMPAALRSQMYSYGAHAAWEAGDAERAALLLRRMAQLTEGAATRELELLAECMLLSHEGRFADVAAHIDASGSRGASLLGFRARAAVETGDAADALRACRRAVALAPHTALADATVRTVLAGLGRREFVADAVRRRLPVVAGPAGVAQLALARAHEAAGDTAAARPLYEAAARRGRGLVRRTAAESLDRLASGSARRLTAPPELAAEVAELEAYCLARREQAHAARAQRPVATWSLAALTVAISAAVQLATGGSELGLLGAGALSAPLVAEGQWWRLVTPMLLHAGWLHLALNVGCIVPVGALVERRLGRAGLVAVYVASGIAGSLGSVLLNHTAIGVGASGAAMGLIGAFLALLLRRPRLFGVEERRRWLSLLWLSIAATAAIGIAEFQSVDNAAHGAGLLAGFLCALPLLPPHDGGAPGTARRRLARALAWLLVAVSAVATVLAADDARAWLGEREIAADGVRVTAPAWLRADRTEEGGLVLARSPAEVRILVRRGPVDVAAALAALAPDLPTLRGREPVGASRGADRARLVRIAPASPAEARALDPPWQDGVELEFRTVRGVSVVGLLPATPDARALYAALVQRVARSARAAE